MQKRLGWYKMSKNNSKKRAEFHKKIRAKEAVIRNSNNKIDFTESEAIEMLKKYGFGNYDIKFWGDIHIQSKYDNWVVSVDDREVITLLHSTFLLNRMGNNRSSYHIQDVFYDLDYCLKTIYEHDMYKEKNSNSKDNVNSTEYKKYNNTE